MPTKDDQFYGYITVWEGYPFYTTPELPKQYGSCTIAEDYPVHTRTLNIDPGKTVPPIAAGDTVILNNYSYLILAYESTYIEIEPTLQIAVSEGTVGNVITTSSSPSTFKTVEANDPLTILEAYNNGYYAPGATTIVLTIETGTPEAGQQLIVSSETYTITHYNPLTHTVTINPGLEYPLADHTKLSQTRNQVVLIKDVVGDIFLNDMLRLGNFLYTVIGFGVDPLSITIETPGIQEHVNADVTGTVYH
jgi:hypothetical protein